MLILFLSEEVMWKKIADPALMYILMDWPSAKVDRALIMTGVTEC